MSSRVYNVLFLCTGNSARSILAESLLNDRGRGRFRAFSAGSFPKGQVHPLAVETLRRHRVPVNDLRSKSWNEFTRDDAPSMDFIVTVCDNAAGEVCPIWPGKPVTAHWGIPDPAAVEDQTQRSAAFEAALLELDHRIERFIAVPFEALGRREAEAAVRAIAAVE